GAADSCAGRSLLNGDSSGSAESSLKSAATANLPAGVRQGGAAVCRRSRRLSRLPAAAVGAGTVGPGAACARAAHPTGTIPRGEEPGQFRLPGDSVVEQGAGSGTGPQ